MTADRDTINRRNRERYQTDKEYRLKRQESHRKYYLSHSEKWRLYAKTRRQKVHDQIKEQCGGMQL